jgi:hypothetical protein
MTPHPMQPANSDDLERTLSVKPGDPFYMNVPTTKNEVVERRFRNLPKHEASRRMPVNNEEQKIIKLAITADNNQAMGTRVTGLLEKMFGRDEEFTISVLSLLEVTFMSELFSVMSEISKEGDEIELVMLDHFLVKFTNPNQFRLLKLAKDERFGTQPLVAELVKFLKRQKR